MRKILFLFILLIPFVSCKQNPIDDFVDLDLMKYGVPIKIKAPKNVKVDVNDMGMVKDVTVKNDQHYSLQIMTSIATESDVSVLINKELEDVKKGGYFSKIMHQDEQGFVFEKNIDGKLNYDFRLIRIQGEEEYDFQRSLMGTYTLEQVDLMYESVK